MSKADALVIRATEAKTWLSEQMEEKDPPCWRCGKVGRRRRCGNAIAVVCKKCEDIWSRQHGRVYTDF